MNAFYATSSYYEQFHFILPIQYKQLRNLNPKNSKQFESIKQQSFSITRLTITLISLLFLIGTILMILFQSLWRISYFWTLFWLLFIYLWTYYTGSGLLFVNFLFIFVNFTFTFTFYLHSIFTYNIIHIHCTILSKSTTTIIFKNNYKNI